MPAVLEQRPVEQAAASGTLLPLICKAQNYVWGRPSERSEVASLAGAAGQRVTSGERYAELWMGTHPSGPSTLADGQTLADWVKEHPEALGPKVTARFGSDLPYLFKVLSVETALSIQAHPDKALAAQLHADRPDIYKDGNHKPEMAVAISDDFSALCQFVSRAELCEALRTVPEITTLVGQESVGAYLTCSDDDVKAQLKALFAKLMAATDEAVTEAVSALLSRLETDLAAGRELSNKEKLALHLNKDYPLDIGIVSVFFLNLVELKAGQAISLDANEPHAYLSGELVEIMATSDNVVRAGLTPKLKDVEVLVEMLTYKQGMPNILEGSKVREHTVRYLPPMDEFQLERVDLPASSTASIPAVAGPGLILVQTGSAQLAVSGECKMEMGKGHVVFVPANTEVNLESSIAGAQLWVANVSSRLWET